MENNNNYKPNSHKYNEENKKVQKVVTGKVKTKKKSEVKKFADTFISEDTSKIKDYLVNDLLLPTIKQTIYDMFTNGLSMALFGEPGRFKSSSTPATKVRWTNYNDISSGNRVTTRPAINRNTYNYDDIILPTKGDAESVIMGLEEIIKTYGFASVADLYDLVGVSGDYTANKYGWTDLHSADAIRLRTNEYLLKLPRALALD